MKELKLIEAFSAISSEALSDFPEVVCGIGDDTAVIDCLQGDKYLLWTKDSLAQDIHFTDDDISYYNIGRKAMAVNLSDIAAMGGTPKYALVSISAPPEIKSAEITELYKGITDIGDEFGTVVLGGDTTGSAAKLFISVSLIGQVPKDKLKLRKNAKCGEAVMVTGKLGGSLRSKHYSFTPRLAATQVLNRFNVSAMMDISDGLGSDVFKLAKASKCGIMLDSDSLPLSDDALSAKRDKIESALYDGEDFELLFTAPFSETERIVQAVEAETGVAVTVVGEVTDCSGVCVLKTKEKEIILKDKGFDHFG